MLWQLFKAANNQHCQFAQCSGYLCNIRFFRITVTPQLQPIAEI